MSDLRPPTSEVRCPSSKLRPPPSDLQPHDPRFSLPSSLAPLSALAIRIRIPCEHRRLVAWLLLVRASNGGRCRRKRLASSVVLNFAEGYAKTSRPEQRRFFGIARASAQETLAILDIALDLGLIDTELHARGANVGDHVIRMLVKFRR